MLGGVFIPLDDADVLMAPVQYHRPFSAICTAREGVLALFYARDHSAPIPSKILSHIIRYPTIVQDKAFILRSPVSFKIFIEAVEARFSIIQ